MVSERRRTLQRRRHRRAKLRKLRERWLSASDSEREKILDKLWRINPEVIPQFLAMGNEQPAQGQPAEPAQQPAPAPNQQATGTTEEQGLPPKPEQQQPAASQQPEQPAESSGQERGNAEA